ncbi:MAG: hypothetical protein WAM72_28515, partial [Xanthobacteraceae bacterium]
PGDIGTRDFSFSVQNTSPRARQRYRIPPLKGEGQEGVKLNHKLRGLDPTRRPAAADLPIPGGGEILARHPEWQATQTLSTASDTP